MLSDFEIETPIGHGGMAEVFRGRFKRGPREGVPVAIKRMRPELQRDAASIEFFLSEADITRQLKHPNIIELYEAGISAEGIYIVMEFVDGRDLGAIITQCVERKLLLPVDFACFVVHTVANALHHAHTARGPSGEPLNLVHCDMTPSNVFISNVGEIKLGDFGVAMAAGYGHLRSDMVAGKPQHFAPEQILGEPLSPATDVFALGTIFYELLTNRRAFAGEAVQDIWEEIVAGRVTSPRKIRPEIPEEIERIVMRALTVRRASDDAAVRGLGKLMGRLVGPQGTRYRSADDFAAELAQEYDSAIGTPLAIASVVRGLFKPSAAQRT